MLLGELQVEMGALQRQARVINKLCEEACNLDYLMNKTQCFDLHRWEAIAQKQDIVLPWKSGESRLLKPMDHKAVLLNNFAGVCKACGVTIHDAKDKFEAWVALARAEWRSSKKKLPADAQGEADYNGEIMLNSWHFAWKSRSAEAAGFVSLAQLKPIMEFLATVSRNTTSVERTLKAIKATEKGAGEQQLLEHSNSALIVKAYIAQDPRLLANASCAFYLKFSHLWKALFGQRWGTRQKMRADCGKKRKYDLSNRWPQKRLHKLMWKCIGKMRARHLASGTAGKLAFNGEELSRFVDKNPLSTNDVSDKQMKYIEHHTTKGADVKRRKFQERQRAKGRRFCQPPTQPLRVPTALGPQIDRLKTSRGTQSQRENNALRMRPLVFFPKGYCAKHFNGEHSSLFKNVGSITEAEIIAVEDLSRLDERILRTVVGKTKASLLHTDMLAARLLGMRVADPHFFKQAIARNISTASIAHCSKTLVASLRQRS